VDTAYKGMEPLILYLEETMKKAGIPSKNNKNSGKFISDEMKNLKELHENIK
jgi:hypothetical protein